MFVTTSRLICRRVLQLGASSRLHQQQQRHLSTTPAAALVGVPQRMMMVVGQQQPSSILAILRSDPWLKNITSWIWLIKRTFQPSVLKKKRKCGYLKRSKSVGGRKILKRRQLKGRARLFGA